MWRPRCRPSVTGEKAGTFQLGLFAWPAGPLTQMYPDARDCRGAGQSPGRSAGLGIASCGRSQFSLRKILSCVALGSGTLVQKKDIACLKNTFGSSPCG